MVPFFDPPCMYTRKVIHTCHSSCDAADRCQFPVWEPRRHGQASFEQLPLSDSVPHTPAAPQGSALCQHSLNTIALHGKHISELRCITCHMGSHGATCHPTQGVLPDPTLAIQTTVLVHDLSTPGGGGEKLSW